MTVILTALGLFYVFTAAMVLRRARAEWFLDRALERLSGKPEPDRNRIWYMSSSALVYGGAGLALVLRSGWAVWLLGAGLTFQAVYYALLAPRLRPEEIDPRRWQKAWNAAIVSTAAFALAAYGHRIGVLA
jgi:multisubunit Na+/H+ antiporter MnhB subunit